MLNSKRETSETEYRLDMHAAWLDGEMVSWSGNLKVNCNFQEYTYIIRIKPEYYIIFKFHHRDIMDLSIFLSLILSYLFRLWTMRIISTRSHLSHALHTFATHVCLMANLMPSSLTLFLTVNFYAVHGYAATYMHITHVILHFHSATAMWLPHVLLSWYAFYGKYL